MIQSHLTPGESLLWSGVPKRKFRFERKHLPLLFFIVPFLAFMFIPIIGIFTSDSSVQNKPESVQTHQVPADQIDQTPASKKPSLAQKIFFGLFFLFFFAGIFGFMILGLGTQIGGTAFLNREISYGITNDRLIVVTGKKQKVIHSLHLGSVTDIRMKEWPDGFGTITFGPEPIWPYSMPQRNSTTQLENILEPSKVFQIILQARNSR